MLSDGALWDPVHFNPGFTPRATNMSLLAELGFVEMTGIVVKFKPGSVGSLLLFRGNR